MAFTKIVSGVRTTDFLPPDVPIRGSVSVASGNVNDPGFMGILGGKNRNVGQDDGVLPSLWWLGIVIVFVVLRGYDEYVNR